ncbi:bifunctional UDP-N-acetylglucosamine diphosphorylase/glucosamine-1-phosphate N-acetyltransferase GlmU [Paludicola sp. MB14-C6]|uniref:bifunctional UDP-N-acetylglucosamine diphosphorylase/glucosamine-1-phosphate N-acetyltransferase GlmU n=1 Tax=Paludihabitans sp. MB14-C6 TaxID=3070656 RepID=UPI0027DE8B93|nr:bifunctional UDP-N-acetylglucosamine diphosphorylase/glucosamine-1-phosphate N-acetyltransferase GlmU [Paludicola sp. MB14-C6]WMJ22079.1 bifunctional UDP-N-acetylglucosamine diphosphorylase/glucosamine-1-phosphate N-acetyltransferase GlmU [Paludicola sp. MB14-C6]
MSNKSAIILAAGKGTRMKSDLPKVLCEVLFKPMINWVIDACHNADINNICAVTGYKSELVENILEDNISTAIQKEQKGTGHAVMMAKNFLEKNIDGDVIVLCGDAPFMDSTTIQNAYDMHKKQNNAITVITARLDDPTGYGRIVRNRYGLERIVEQKDASNNELLINEVNSGAYWFNVKYLLEVLFDIDDSNSQGEYYLPDTIALSLAKGRKVNAYISDNPDVILGANSRRDLCNLNAIANRRVIDNHFDNGVEFVSLDGVLISPEVKIGKGTVILPSTILKGTTEIGSGCSIGPNSLVQNSKIENNVVFNASQCYNSFIASNVTIGPFCHIRPNSTIKEGVHLGDFVEIKNSVVGENTHVSHLTYVGDSDVGKNVNFGCGVVTVNYNGKTKARCTIEDDAFIGCNTNLVAPVKVGKRGYTAAGSTITEDVPDASLAIARSRQINKEGYNK